MKRFNKHIITLPKKVIVGEGVVNDLPSIVNELRLGTSALMITGPHVKTVVCEDLIDNLTGNGVRVDVIVAKDPTIDAVNDVLSEVNSKKVDFIIGVGGGKAIDVAKYSSSLLGVPFISVPTAASHDGVASPFASIRGLASITSVKAQTPIAIVADTSIIAKAPKRLLLAGSGDLIGKFTAVLDWRLAHKLKGEYYGDYAASLALLSAKHVLNFSNVISRGGPEAARIVIEGLISSSVAMCIAGSTRPASGSEHLFSHSLDLVANYPALHGEQVALGTVMMSYLHGRNWRRLRRVLKQLGLPATAKELGVPDVKVIEALTMAHKIRPDRYTILGESGLTWEAAEKLAMITGVIS